MTKIFCFSATGNNLTCAKILANNLGAEITAIKPEKTSYDQKMLGLVFPVYFWGLPRPVIDFVRQLEVTNPEVYIFAVAVGGGPSFGVLDQLRQLLAAKHLKLAYGRRLVLLSNYIPYHQPADYQTKRAQFIKASLKIAAAISQNKKNKVWPFTRFNRHIYQTYPADDCDEYFTVSDLCDGCGICQKVCPVRNISLVTGKPEFKHGCSHCLACLHNCPQAALDWNNLTAGKPRYRNPDITLKELLDLNADHLPQ